MTDRRARRSVLEAFEREQFRKGRPLTPKAAEKGAPVSAPPDDDATWQQFRLRRGEHPALPEPPEPIETAAASPPAADEARGSLRWALAQFGLTPDDVALGFLTREDLQRLYRMRSQLFHPDHVAQSTEAAQRYAHERMLDLNEARRLLWQAMGDSSDAD